MINSAPIPASVTFTEVPTAGMTNSQAYRAALLNHLRTDPSHAKSGVTIAKRAGIMVLEAEHNRQHGHASLESLRLREQADPEGRQS